MLFFLMFIGVVTDLASTQGPLFICEQVALDKLVSGLVEPCVCGHVKWEGCAEAGKFYCVWQNMHVSVASMNAHSDP